MRDALEGAAIIAGTGILAALGFVLWTLAFERCDLHRIYREGDVVMVTDVAESLTITSLVCRGGQWKVLK